MAILHASGWGVGEEAQYGKLKAKQGEENMHRKGLPGMENQNSPGLRGPPTLGRAWHVVTE